MTVHYLIHLLYLILVCQVIPQALSYQINPSRLDTNALLLEIRSDVKNTNAKFDNLEKSVATLKSENTLRKEENKKLLQKVEHLSNSVNEVRKIAIDSERRSERVEAQSRRDNLKFYGIDEKKMKRGQILKLRFDMKSHDWD